LDGTDKKVLAHLENCCFNNSTKQETTATSPNGAFAFSFSEISNISHAGVLRVSQKCSGDILRVDFTPGSTHFWHVPGQTDGVFHFPDISAEISFEGFRHHAVGYCKRYWGNYDGPWGYQFIQGAAEDESKFLWTADATFGDDEYNYFKIFERSTKSITCMAEKIDTWHNNQRGFWRPADRNQPGGMQVELTPIAKHEFYLKSDKQYSKLVERFGTIELKKDDGTLIFRGYGFNEICFGTVA